MKYTQNQGIEPMGLCATWDEYFIDIKTNMTSC